MRNTLRTLLLAMLLVSVAPTSPAAAQPSFTPVAGLAYRYFPATGHSITRNIKTFYEANGGEVAFGAALTELFVEDGLQVQYFERARFEIRPDAAPTERIVLTHLGRQASAGRSDPAFQWLAAAPPGAEQYFVESGHSLRGLFNIFWLNNGGLKAFGYPISEELTETEPDGSPLLVQYFERVRFELHIEAEPARQVQLTDLGRRVVAQSPAAAAASRATVQPLTLLGRATTGYSGSSYERSTNVARSASMFEGAVVAPGAVHSFLAAGDISEANGFVEGYGIINGQLDRVLAGGVCQVSTTLFRAVSNAGMDIVTRVPHSFVVNFYDNIVGYDATVFDPEVDFRWRNDNPYPVTIWVTNDAAAGRLTIEIYSTGTDGRMIEVGTPAVSNVRQPGAAIWRFDPKMAPGKVKQLVYGRPGMNVLLTRVVRLPDGRVLHNDRFNTSYLPWNDQYSYGAGVRPPSTSPTP